MAKKSDKKKPVVAVIISPVKMTKKKSGKNAKGC